ncbi:MAG: prepilin peptidase [Candidatus Eremiobacteraeota bacterium]|nr:prepilin peptidase [Candidatus Eremiobacteraeota bacterium]
MAWRRVPNWITLPLLLLAPVATGLELGSRSALVSLAIVSAFIGIGIVIHGAGLLGGGDIKLLAGVAALFGLPACISFALYTAVAGGILALVFAAHRSELNALLTGLFRRVGTSLLTARLSTETTRSSNARMPYALAIGAGFAITTAANAVPILRIFH